MKSKEMALKVNCEPSKDNCGASCYYQYVYFKAKKRVFDSPKKGDKVIFGTKLEHGYVTHIGLVVAVDGNKITTVEGNKSNQVRKCTYTLGAKNSKILKFLRPIYNDIVTADKVIAYALSQVGYKETGNNHNKFSKLLDSIDYYNTKKDPAGADWCAIFTDACVYECTEVKEESKPASDEIKQQKTASAASFNKIFNKEYTVASKAPLMTAPNKTIMGYIPVGKKVRCYGFFSGDYLYITYGKFYGFCKRSFLR